MFFFFAGLVLLVGIIIYVGAVTEEAGSKKKGTTAEEARFVYDYGALTAAGTMFVRWVRTDRNSLCPPLHITTASRLRHATQTSCRHSHRRQPGSVETGHVVFGPLPVAMMMS